MKMLNDTWFRLACIGSVAVMMTMSVVGADFGALLTGANEALKKGQLTEASASVEAAIAEQPSNFRGHALLGVIRRRQGREAEARTAFQKAISLAEGADRARLEGMLSEPPTGKAPAVTSETTTPEQRLERATLMLRAKDVDQADSLAARQTAAKRFLEESRTYVGRFPDDASIWLLRAGMALEVEDKVQAWEAGQQLKRLGVLEKGDERALQVLAKLNGAGLLNGEDPRVTAAREEETRRKAALAAAEAERQREAAELAELSRLSGGKLEQGELADQAWWTELGLPGKPEAGYRKEFGGGKLPTIVMRWIPAGTFKMGSPESEKGRDADETQHTVVLTRGFWMAETETTQAQWKGIRGNNPSSFKGDGLPVEYVDWKDAVKYCEKMTEMHRKAGLLLTNILWRLPTEAEWEYACRAGSSGPYHGRLDEVAWYTGNSGKTTHPVGEKAANAWGLRDMHGNVLEWCADWYAPYFSGVSIDPKGPSSGVDRVRRGGSWSHIGQGCRSALRNRNDPGYLHFNLGFRVALVRVP